MLLASCLLLGLSPAAVRCWSCIKDDAECVLLLLLSLLAMELLPPLLVLVVLLQLSVLMMVVELLPPLLVVVVLLQLSVLLVIELLGWVGVLTGLGGDAWGCVETSHLCVGGDAMGRELDCEWLSILQWMTICCKIQLPIAAKQVHGSYPCTVTVG